MCDNVDNTKAIKHLSLCAGYGGIDLGLSRVMRDLRTICFVEIEAFAIENLVAKIEAGLLDLAPVYTDLKIFPFGKFRGCVDILSGGFPCQPFSAAGKRTADDDPRHLFPFIIKGIRECRPPVVFLENVEGIISSKLKGDHWNDPEGTPVLLHVLRELERVGYQATAGVFSAVEVGAPHQRKRVFIMAKDGDVKLTVDERTSATCYPAGRGQDQHGWEPPKIQVQTESTLGRDFDGTAHRLDTALLYESVDNRTDELRLLGNGVVPDTAARAFRLLWRDLADPSSLTEG